MTINKESRIKTLRQDGRFIEICGGSPMYADAEYYHTEIILKNAIQLYRKKKYELLLIYLSHAKFRITWSEDNRLNQLNIVLCQLFLKSLLKFHTLDEILHEFDASSVAESESFFEGIGDSMNFPVKQMKLYGYELNFYHDSPLYKVNAYFKSNQHPIFDLKQSDSVEIKKHSILQNQLKEMVHLKK